MRGELVVYVRMKTESALCWQLDMESNWSNGISGFKKKTGSIIQSEVGVVDHRLAGGTSSCVAVADSGNRLW